MSPTNILGFQSEVKEGDSITGGTLNTTIGAAYGVALVAVVTAINETFDTIFGGEVPTWVKPAVIMTAMFGLAIVAAADVLARGYASGKQVPRTSALPGNLKATHTTDDVTVEGYLVVALQSGTGGEPDKYLITKKGQQPKWVEATTLKFE